MEDVESGEESSVHFPVFPSGARGEVLRPLKGAS